MANATSTSTRYEQLAALMTYAKENGYTGETDKLEKVATQWSAKGGDTATKEENIRLAGLVKDWMTAGESYTNEQIRDGVAGLPVGTRGKVEPSKVNAVMNAGISEGLFTVEVLGKMRFFTLAA